MASLPRIAQPSAPSWISASASHDTVVALEAEAGPDRPWIVGFALGLVALSLAALPVIPIDVTLRVVGQVRPKTETVEIRSPMTAQVEEVLIGRGTEVVEGQTLLRLANGPLRARVRRLEDEQVRGKREYLDWAALIAHLRDARSADPRLESDWARQALAEFRAKTETLRLQEQQARQTLARLKPLLARGLIPEQEYDEAEHLASRIQAEKRLVQQQALASWERSREEAERGVDRLEAERKLAEAELATLTLSSSVPGVVLEMTPLRPGAVVVAGQLLGRISVDDVLQIEAAVPSRAAALVKPGQEAKVAFSALPSMEWGLMRGVVEAVAADVQPAAPLPLYRVTLRPLADRMIHRDGREAHIRKGFGAEVHLFLGTTTLFLHLRRKASDWIHGDDLSPTGDPTPFPQNLSRQPNSWSSSSGETGG
ncbi:MAG TPA: HlyD family efflux transporter periplasmic adaptor subunit [Opitutaceae bacterium]|nr:HlyD family efflux transporter periplasmic adaptor subunit [Opitutaceae bacterium]